MSVQRSRWDFHTQVKSQTSVMQHVISTSTTIRGTWTRTYLPSNTWYLFFFQWYCWWLKSCTSWYGKFPIIHGALYIPGGCLEFLPSTVPSSKKGRVVVGHTYSTKELPFGPASPTVNEWPNLPQSSRVWTIKNWSLSYQGNKNIVPGPSKGCQMVVKGCQLTIP